jgi:hypothetical protein
MGVCAKDFHLVTLLSLGAEITPFQPTATPTNVPGAGYRKTGIGGAEQCRYWQADIPEEGKCRE